MSEHTRVDEFLTSLLAICKPLESFEMPLLDAHGATLAADIYAGDRLVLREGTRIRSTQIGLAASIGRDHLPTRPHPRVVVLSAGPDLVEPGQALKNASDEYETNSWLLTTAVREVGAVAYRVHSIPDNEEQLQKVIEDQLVRADLVVISSGPRSVEMMRESLNALGEMHEREVAMAPTGHHSYGLIGPDRTPVITLTSDASGAYIAFELFVRPMIRQMLGRKNLSHRKLSAILVGEISSACEVRSFHEALISHENEVLRAKPVLAGERSEANGLIVIDERPPTGSSLTSLPSGSEVSVILFDRQSE